MQLEDRTLALRAQFMKANEEDEGDAGMMIAVTLSGAAEDTEDDARDITVRLLAGRVICDGAHTSLYTGYDTGPDIPQAKKTHVIL